MVPDSVRFDFAGCVFTHHMGQVTDSLDGTIDIVDPLPLATSHGVRHTFTQFTRARTNEAFPARSFVAVHDGSREWGASPDTLGHTVTNFVTQWIHAGGFTSIHEKNWVGKFTAAAAGTIQAGRHLDAGGLQPVGARGEDLVGGRHHDRSSGLRSDLRGPAQNHQWLAAPHGHPGPGRDRRGHHVYRLRAVHRDSHSGGLNSQRLSNEQGGGQPASPLFSCGRALPWGAVAACRHAVVIRPVPTRARAAARAG
jgi:hypothetical protein